MRTFSVTTLILSAAFATAAPALGEKPARWEYAELTFRTIAARPAGVDADGNQIPAVPASMSIRWISKEGEIEARGWIELTEKLKASGFKKDGSAAFQKIQFLNYLGSEGWELMELGSNATAASMSTAAALAGRGPGGDRPAPVRTTTSPTTWMLKRKLP